MLAVKAANDYLLYQDTTWLGLLIGLSFAIAAIAWYRLAREKRAAEKLIQEQKLQLDTAINNMTQGLNLVDASGRLVLCNDRYLQMYGLSRDAALVGSTVRDLVTRRVAAGTFFATDPEQYISDVKVSMAARTPNTATRPMADGRIITVISRPIANGGWVVTHEDVTERHRLLQAHEKTEERLRVQTVQFTTALENMSQGLLLFDADKRIVLCNHRYIEMYGLSPDVVKPGLGFHELIQHRKDQGTFVGDVDKYCDDLYSGLAAGEAVGLIVGLPNGRSIQILNEPVGGGWVATHEDVTERQRLLRELEQSERLLRRQKLELDGALENMCQGLCMYDADGRMVLFNRRYVEMMAMPADYLQDLPLVELLRARKARGDFDGNPEEFYADILSRVRGGGITKITRSIRGRDLRVVDQPMAGGGWIATFEDITDQLELERESDRTRRILELIIDNVPTTIFLKNAGDGRYVLINRAGEKLWGFSREEALGKTAGEVFPPDEAAIIAARDAKLLQTGDPSFDEREITVASGGTRSIHARRMLVQDTEGKSTYVLGVIDDITERKLADARIAHLAHYDALTDLPNRLLLRERLEYELAYVRRGGKLAVLYIDLDHFKGVNDTLGHTAGDELLKAVAARLRGCLRDTDTVARLGGDEFAIVQAPLKRAPEAAKLAQRLRDAVVQSPFEINGHQVVVDLSIGIALAPNDGREVDQLLKNADMALYGAKAEGRGTYRYFESAMDARMKRRRQLETDLRSALTRGEFELHYQPLVRVADNEIGGWEALLRWRHPQRGLVPADEFIPVAEETGLIIPIGDWVLRQACIDAATWRDDIKVAVNLSAAQFRSQALLQTVIGSLAASGLNANRLELEITESVLMHSNETTLRTLHQLRELGIRVAMDDFGTRYSSLSYLRSFPFDKIKIDRSFVHDLLLSVDSSKIVEAMVWLAHNLNMTVTAEGVESEEQLIVLREMGCNEMQGYLFGKPIPADEVLLLASPSRARLKRAG